MAFNKNETISSGVNILESEIGLVTKTYEGTQTIAVTEDGKKVIKAGTAYPSNDNKAIGVVFEDVDITDDVKRPISVIVAGRVKKDLVTVSEAAQGVLTDIKFV